MNPTSSEGNKNKNNHKRIKNIETAIEAFWAFNMIGGDGIPESIAEIEFEIFTRILIYGEFQQILFSIVQHVESI